MSELKSILDEIGPARSSRITELLESKYGLNPAAARKRVSRAGSAILRFPIPLLPKREGFLYLRQQRTTERFWMNLVSALRETGSVYGAALDGLAARGGVVAGSEFAVISGAPVALKKQVSASRVADTLVNSGAIQRVEVPDLGECYAIDRPEIAIPDFPGFRARQMSETVVLDGMREWARKLGLGSYDKIVIRGDNHPRKIGQFMFDLTAPSYLLPLRKGKKNGFFAADVFVDGVLDENAIKYFIRKTELLRASSINSGFTLTMLVAESFTGPALTAGRAAGIVLATPANLFGVKVAAAIKSLVYTLKNAAAIAVDNPQRIAKLITDLTEIEGAAGNLRGILFDHGYRM